VERESAHRELRQELLRLLGLDYCLLWEPLGVAKRVAPALDTDQQISLALEGIRRLFKEQLVYFFRCDFDVDDVDRAGADDSSHLSPQTVHALLAAREWARWPPQDAGRIVWFGLTRKGLAALHAQEEEEDVEWLTNCVRHQFDRMDDREIIGSIEARVANKKERQAGKLAELRFEIEASAIDVSCASFRRIEDLDAAWAVIAAGTTSEIFDARWHNERDFVCGLARLASRSTGGWEIAWTDHAGHVLIVAAAEQVGLLVDLFVNSAFKREGRRFLVGPDGRMGVRPSALATDPG
jgi:hypothetical protein